MSNIKLPKIYGFNKSSESGGDPFACSIFLGGCNMLCPYCLNHRLIDLSKHNGMAEKNIEDIGKYVKDNNVNMVIISGGEPTLSPLESLVLLIGEIKSWGCNVGMSTNGTNPSTLRSILPELTFVAIDLKSPSHGTYAKITKKSRLPALSGVMVSKRMIEQEGNRAGFSYEIRTTLFPEFIKEDSLRKMGKEMITWGEKWVLQQFRVPFDPMDVSLHSVIPYTLEQIKELEGIAKEYTPNVSLRYI